MDLSSVVLNAGGGEEVRHLAQNLGLAANQTSSPVASLSKIAKQFYGNANSYMKIFEANKDQLIDPNKIRVGQVLKISAS